MTQNGQPADGTILGRLAGGPVPDTRPNSPTHGRLYEVELVANAKGDHLSLGSSRKPLIPGVDVTYKLRKVWV